MSATIFDIAKAVAEKLNEDYDEVFNWLCNGDNPNTLTMNDVDDIVNEWKEWNGQ